MSRPRAGALLALSALVVVAGALWTVSLGLRHKSTAFLAGSVFDESPEGLSLARRYLDESARRSGRHAPAAILSRRLTRDALPQDGVLFRMRPRRLPFPAERQELTGDRSAREGDSSSSGARARKATRAAEPRPLLTAAEEAWVRGGGRLVLGLDDGYGPLSLVDGRRARGPVRKVFPVWPGVRTLAPEGPLPLFGGRPLPAGHALFASGPVAAITRLPMGRGEVLLLALPQVLENARLAKADHLRLLESLAGGRPVAFDEWAHGYGEDPGLLSQLIGWGLGPSLGLGALGFGLLLWRGRMRLGPLEPEPAETRTEAVDLVDSLAQLYARALTRRDALTLHVEGLRAALSLRTGLRGEALERRLAESVGGAPISWAGTAELTPSQFLRGLAAVNEGFRRLREHGDTRRSA